MPSGVPRVWLDGGPFGVQRGIPETRINVDHIPGPRGPVTFEDLCLRQYMVTPYTGRHPLRHAVIWLTLIDLE